MEGEVEKAVMGVGAFVLKVVRWASNKAEEVLKLPCSFLLSRDLKYPEEAIYRGI